MDTPVKWSHPPHLIVFSYLYTSHVRLRDLSIISTTSNLI